MMKTIAVRFGKHIKYTRSLTVNDTEIKCRTKIKYLGITLNSY